MTSSVQSKVNSAALNSKSVFLSSSKLLKDDLPTTTPTTNMNNQEEGYSPSLDTTSSDDGHQQQHHQQQHWAERFEMPLFLLTQFNVHYLSWIKYPEHLVAYLDRLNRLSELVAQLPEFSCSSSSGKKKKMEPADGGAEQQQMKSIHDWLVTQSTLSCFAYHRQLLLRLPTVFGRTRGLLMRVSLLEKEDKDGQGGQEGTVMPIVLPDATVATVEQAGPATEPQDEEEEEEEEEEKGEEVGLSGGSAVENEEEDVSHADHLATEKEDDDCDQSTAEPKKTDLAGTEICTWGDIKMCPGQQQLFSIPKEVNLQTQKHIYLKLVVLDTESPPTPGRQPLTIYISEAAITGFSGLSKRFRVDMKHKKKKEEEKEGDGVEEKENVEDLVVNSVCAEEAEQEQEEQEVIEETDELEFELSLKWQIESDCFAQLVANPVAILNKLPGALFLLGGDHYWHFYRDFYRWAALESEDATVRYAAIQAFHHISLVLSPELLFADMRDIFVQMCLYGVYPLPDQLTLSTEGESGPKYVCEPVSLLDNLVTIFSCLFTEEQMEAVRRLVPFAGALLRVRPLFLHRLVRLLSQCLANYDDGHSLVEVVMPLATALLVEVATRVEDPAAELVDPRTGRQSWASVSELAAALTTLIVECVQVGRPQEWASLPVEHPAMATTARLLEQLIGALFSPHPHCIALLKGIYGRLRSKKVLLDEHLAAFLTVERVKQYRKWS